MNIFLATVYMSSIKKKLPLASNVRDFLKAMLLQSETARQIGGTAVSAHH